MKADDSSVNFPQIYSLRTSCSTTDELFREVGLLMVGEEIVAKDFVSALIKREEQFPTGLQLDGATVAMPHVDARFSLKTAIVVAVNDAPVDFRRMDDPEKMLAVRVAIFLVINDATKQVVFLSRLSHMFADQNFSRLVNTADDPEPVAQYLKTVLEEERGESYA